MFMQAAASLLGLVWRRMAFVVVLTVVVVLCSSLPTAASNLDELYEQKETRDLVALVNDASELVRTKGEAAFADFAVSGSRWREGESYIFVLDREGNMVVHPDPAMVGRNQMDLKDINGRPIIQGLVAAVTTHPGKSTGWYHYEFPVPGGLLPRWKSSYVTLVEAPSGKSFVVGSGMYNDRMERAFVVDTVTDAVRQIEKNGKAAFARFHDRTGPFISKDAYIFVIDPTGVDLVNPGFPSLEGRNILDVKDTHGKQLVREMLQVVQTSGTGWVDYMWPKPGDSVSTQKSAYLSKAKIGNDWVLVGCGVYLADAPREAPSGDKITAQELMALVREGAAVLEQQGESAYRAFREKGSKWFHGETYIFVWKMDGTLVFHAADQAAEGRNDLAIKDVLGRPFGRMIYVTGTSTSGEGWIHYMYPEPGNIFPTWKSTFVKRVTFPSGEQHILGCGIYNMQMEEAFVQDVVNRAAALVEAHGEEAFSQLRDRTGPFVFMDTYVFVQATDGTELVNAAQPSLEGKNLIDVRDVNGKPVAQELIATATKNGSGWVGYYWYRPGSNEPALKRSFVRMVQSGEKTYVVGSGFYKD